MIDTRLDTQIVEDLMAAAKYLLLDGHSIDPEEAVRIGMALAAHAGKIEGCMIMTAEPKRNPKR